MTVATGTKLGPYEIQSQLGEGGMGEVYRANDTRLDRTVAVKVLASQVSATPEFKQRMEREARAISSLNHPHICQLYDIGSQNGTEYLVMEFLDGETLAERLRKGPLPIGEVLKAGIAIAEALAAAHRHGIIHRDLKPGNIMLTPAGAKLMDFGLAKPAGIHNSAATSASAPSFTAVATLSGPSPLSPLTTAGTIVGTIQYMSPEQIEGKEADARSDIFAFGAVLYEMATAKRPFTGKSQLSLASSILEKDPDPITSFDHSIPPAFDRLVTTCLEKNPDDRFQSAQDIKLELQWIASDQSPTVAAPSTPSHKREWVGWAIALLVGIGLGVLAGILLHRAPAPAASIRTVINPPEKTTINLTGDNAGPPVLSPNGTTIAFTGASEGKTMIWVRPINSLEAHEVPGTDNAIFPFWSFDSRSLGFFSDGKLKTVDLDGGSVQVIADAPFGRGGAWGADGAIVYSPLTQSGLMRVNALGGTPTPVTQLDRTQHTSHRWPFFLPDGRHFIYLAMNHDPAKAANNRLYYASIDGRENRVLLRSQSNAIYADDYLMFARGDQLMAQSFDPNRGTLKGVPQSVAKGIANDAATWHMDASASEGGLLIFGSGGTGDWQLLWLDRATKQITTVADKLTNLRMAEISPQGDRVAMVIDNGVPDVWVLDLTRGVRTRLTFGPTANNFPVWSPDGKWIAYTSDQNGHANLCRKPADGSGAEEILHVDDQQAYLTDWSRDGKILFYQRGPVGSEEIWALPLEGQRKPFLVVPHTENSFAVMGNLSPDGRWLAYTSSESGVPQVYVVAFHNGQGKWQVSVNGVSNNGGRPRWSQDGKELYYMDTTYNLVAVPVKEIGGALQFGAPQQLVINWSAPEAFFDISPDNKRVLLDRISQQVNQSVTVMTNFTLLLKQ